MALSRRIYAGLIEALIGEAQEQTGMPVLRLLWYDGAFNTQPTPEHRTLRVLPDVKVRLGELVRRGMLVQQKRGVIELGRNSRHFVLFRTTRGLRLLDVADSPWMSRAGGNAAISSGLRSTAREWARAIYRHYSGPQAVDGIFYTCSTIPPARSVALWERARDAVPDRPLIHLPLADPALRAELEVYATDLGLGLLP